MSLRAGFFEAFLRAPHAVRTAGANVYGYWLAHKRFGGEFHKYLRFLECSQHWSRNDLERWQMERLRHVLTIASTRVPYYRRLFSELGLRVDDFVCVDDLARLPVLTKAIIRANGKNMMRDDFLSVKSVLHETSGTTGEKLRFRLPPELAYSFRYAVMWRHYSWAGVHPGERRVTIGGRLFTRRPPYYLHNRAERQLLLSAHHLTPVTAPEYIRQIRDFKPRFMQGHPTAIHYLACYLLRRDEVLRVPAVFTTGETLPEENRREVEAAFQAQVFEDYGLGEAVIDAIECERHQGFHEVSELGLIQYEDRPGTELKGIVGTSLRNDIMPFVRYRIEDLVELPAGSACSCGRGLPLKVARVLGRIDDVIHDAAGAMVLPVTIRMSVKPLLKEFQSYQVRQVGQRQYIVALTIAADAQQQERFRRVLSSLLGPLAVFEFQYEPSLTTSGGKVRTVVREWSPAKSG